MEKTKEYTKNRCGEENGNNMLQIRLEEDGDHLEQPQSSMKKSGLCPVLYGEWQGLMKKERIHL